MQLEQSFTLPLAPAEAWAAFQRIELLVECLPGATLTGPAGHDGQWPLRFDVKLGPIAASFVGSGTVSHDDTARSGRFEGGAADKRTQSRVKGAAEFAVLPDAAGSSVQVRVDYQLTGALAQFGRGGIVRELASALTQQFAANLEKRLSAAPAVVAPAAAAVGVAAPASLAATGPAGAALDSRPAAVPPAGASLDAGALLWRVARARLRALRAWLRPGQRASTPTK